MAIALFQTISMPASRGGCSASRNDEADRRSIRRNTPPLARKRGTVWLSSRVQHRGVDCDGRACVTDRCIASGLPLSPERSATFDTAHIDNTESRRRRRDSTALGSCNKAFSTGAFIGRSCPLTIERAVGTKDRDWTGRFNGAIIGPSERAAPRQSCRNDSALAVCSEEAITSAPCNGIDCYSFRWIFAHGSLGAMNR